MSVDTIGNFLTIIRNGIHASHYAIQAPYSRMKFQIASILKDEGFVRDVVVNEEEGKKTLHVVLKYVDGESVIHEINRISTPGRRVYQGITTLKPVIGNLGVAILTTNRGVMTSKAARKFGVGGEVICTVW